MNQPPASTRKTNPEAVPAAPAAPMDAAFFARLRVIDDRMFVTAAAASAVKGRVQEISHALTTLRGDLFEPLLYEGEKPAFTSSVTEGSMWDVVALALTSDTKGWDVVSTESFVFRNHPGHRSPFDEARDADNRALLTQSIDLCAAQGRRVHAGENEVSHTRFYSSGPDGLSCAFGPAAWMVLIKALSHRNCEWSHINAVIDAVPHPSIQKNRHEFQRLAHRLIQDGNAPCALRLIDREEGLRACLFQLHSRDRETDCDSANSLRDMASKVCSTDVDPEEADLLVQASLDILDRFVSGEGNRYSSEFLVQAIDTMLPSLTGREYETIPTNNSWEAAPKLKVWGWAQKMIDGLVARVDVALGSGPGDAWPTVSSAESLQYGNQVSMRDLLENALSQRQPDLVDKLSGHWAVSPQQVDLLKIAEGLARPQVIVTEELKLRVIRILGTAKAIGIDLNQPVSGEIHETWQRGLSKPTFPLHTIAKATKYKPGQLALLQAMVAMDIDPTVTDKRGWKARVFLSEADRPAWDETVHRFAVRQRAIDAMNEIVSGDPAPKRPRVRKPAPV